MRLRPAIAVAACSLVVVACGSGDDSASTPVEVTLLPTTTSTTEPVFVAVDSVPDVELDAGDDIEETVDELVTTDMVSTDVATATSVEPVSTIAPDSDPPGTDPAAPTTDAPVGTTFTLATDGLGSTSFGADPDGTIDFVSSFFGEPTADTGWVDPFTIGICGGTQLRQVDWNDLRLEFGDVSSIRQDRTHFYAYTYGAEGSMGRAVPPGLATPEGITAGSTVAELIAAYPATDLRAADATIAANFIVNANLTGRMSGLADDDVVELIIGGVPCEG